ncbi:tRNA-His guanylyltransferase [Metarhizium robertsii ARSEF 23]|uniref:tRNA(His) guanylyltransferase n=2 Tax=Metarhizium TaxID=5529 RepID=E9EM02_METRA
MCAKYKFQKPNDRRALDLMNVAAMAVVTDIPEIIIAYGVSDEYSFVLHKSCDLFERRASKLVSTIVSTFTANYVFSWPTCFPDTPLSFPLPTFDGRAVCYPSVQNLRDYLSWRQVDCHINNLYNTTFWSLVQLGGLDNKDAERTLAYELVDPGSHSVAAEMDDLAEPVTQSKTQTEKDKKRRAKARVVVQHLDIIKDDFWDRRPWILSNKPGKAPKET